MFHTSLVGYFQVLKKIGKDYIISKIGGGLERLSIEGLKVNSDRILAYSPIALEIGETYYGEIEKVKNPIICPLFIPCDTVYARRYTVITYRAYNDTCVLRIANKNEYDPASHYFSDNFSEFGQAIDCECRKKLYEGIVVLGEIVIRFPSKAAFKFTTQKEDDFEAFISSTTPEDDDEISEFTCFATSKEYDLFESKLQSLEEDNLIKEDNLIESELESLRKRLENDSFESELESLRKRFENNSNEHEE